MQSSTIVLVAAVLLAVGLAAPVVDRSLSYIDQANRNVAGRGNETVVEGLGVLPEDQSGSTDRATVGDAEEMLQQARLAIESARQAIAKGEEAGADVSEATRLVEEAQEAFEAGQAYFAQGDYQEAYLKGQRAKTLADQSQLAVNQQLWDMAEEALRAIESAEETIRRAEDLQGSLNLTAFNPASQAGVLSSWSLISFQPKQPSSPEGLLSQAEELLARARVAYDVRDFGEAIWLAEEAKKLADMALNQLLDPSMPVTEDVALTAIARAKTAEISAYEKVGYVVTLHVDASMLMDQVRRASDILDEADEFLQEGENGQARAKAIQSWRIFQSAEERADRLAAEAQTTLENVQSIDAFAVGTEGPLEFSSDDSGNLVAAAENHFVTIQRSHPALSYSVEGNGGIASFEANVFALIEFADNDGDNVIDEDEIVEVLQLQSLDWTHVQQNTTRIDKSIEAWYHFQSSEHNLWIALKVFEAPTLQHLSVEDEILMWFVDGNARDVKLDLIVEKWTWTSPKNQLALRLLVSPKEEGVVRTREVGIGERWIGISYENATVRIKSMMKAVVFEDSQRLLVDVAMESRELHGGEIQVDLVYPNFGENRLVHDPSLGIGGPFAYEPIFGTSSLVLGIAILGVVILATGRPLEKMKLRRA
ncbi:MAG: hypothetical protein ACETV0_05045 [Nitrososphaeria archaeon]